MLAIPLVTSIPPRMTRISKGGVDVGQEYALQCIQSWRRYGFEPISVNAKSEAGLELLAIQNIKSVTVERDARAQCGKPLVFLGDLINVASAVTDGPVVITNADILLDMTEATRTMIASLKPGQCIVANRTDVKSMHNRKGRVYHTGYDFFAYHSADLGNFPPNEFIFGSPWWDHYLPIILFLRGLKPVTAADNFTYHLLHSERWNKNLFISLGNEFVTLLNNEIKSPDNCSVQFPSGYARLLELATAEHSDSAGLLLKVMPKKLIEQWRAYDHKRILIQLARCNKQWLDNLMGF